MIKRHILVFDKQGSVSAELRRLIPQDFVFSYTQSAIETRQALRNAYFLVVLVVFEAASFLKQQQETEPLIAEASQVEWIALTESEALESHEFQEFILRTFYDYHTRPLDLERLRVTLGHACGKAQLRAGLNGKKENYGKFHICGTSPVMTTFFRRLEKVINTDAPVLISGETGTGKELVAQAIHKNSSRSNGPLVAINCGAIAATLIQSEFFGHEKGAFTGSVQRQIGKIESANGGVLFLDEIGDLPLDMQTSLLRVLQERTFSRVGSTQVISVDFRVIAATHVNLHEAVAQGRFREDLFYRLNVIQLELPPLRKRGGDIALLAEAVFQKYFPVCKNNQIKGFSKEALRALSTYDWPGNVRELVNRIQRAMVMSENRLISPADLGLESLVSNHPRLTRDLARASFDRDLLETSLRKNGYIVSQTARQLGVSRVTLYRMMNKLNIAPDQ